MTRVSDGLAFLACGFLGFLGAQANTPVPKPICDSSKDVSVRYSSTSQRIYLESVDGSRGGCASPTSVYQALGEASPLYPLETPGEWMLDESLYILDGIVLNVYGTDIGGDCDYLKLRSDADMIVNVRAHGGSLDFVNTKVTSWDVSKGDVDSDWGDGRAYVSAISEVLLDAAETCEGVAKNEMGEARMDIENSEIAYLGYEASESWGISWKLRGICNDKSNRGLYDGIGVYGNLLNSDVHHLYYGQYGYAHQHASMTGNTIHDNEVYGFDPHDDSVNITISHNEVYFNFHHGIIFSKYCLNTIVTNNYVHDNGGVGIFPHYVSDNAVIAHNIVEQNGDSGIAFLESSDSLVYNNTIRNNVHGIRFSVGSRNNIISQNTFEKNQGYDLYQYAGNDDVVQVESGSPTHNIFFDNTFSGNAGGARLDDSTETQLVSNTANDWSRFEARDSTNTLLLGNTFPPDMTYTSSSSCINSASDVAFGDICSDPATTNPFDETAFAKAVGEPTQQQQAPQNTQAPSDSQPYVPISAAGSSVSPTADATASPTAASASLEHTSIVIISSDSTPSGGGGTESLSPTGITESMSPTNIAQSISPTPGPALAGLVPADSEDGADVARDLSAGTPVVLNRATALIGVAAAVCVL